MGEFDNGLSRASATRRSSFVAQLQRVVWSMDGLLALPGDEQRHSSQARGDELDECT
jgi:hypothetical protein